MLEANCIYHVEHIMDFSSCRRTGVAPTTSTALRDISNLKCGISLGRTRMVHLLTLLIDIKLSVLLVSVDNRLSIVAVL